MKKLIIIFVMTFTAMLYGQMEMPKKIIMASEYLSENKDISDLLFFEGIEFYKLKFTGENLKGATYKIVAKEIWNGKIITTSLVTDSAIIDIPEFAKIKDTIFEMKVISKLTHDNTLKMSFKFPRYGKNLEYKAIKSNDYSLRNIAENNSTLIEPGKKFYLFAYILPYEIDGAKYWCAVENSGKNIENWGKEFGIEHYIVFEMCFDCLN
jgi:hypothetical protein